MTALRNVVTTSRSRPTTTPCTPPPHSASISGSSDSAHLSIRTLSRIGSPRRLYLTLSTNLPGYARMRRRYQPARHPERGCEPALRLRARKPGLVSMRTQLAGRLDPPSGSKPLARRLTKLKSEACPNLGSATAMSNVVGPSRGRRVGCLEARDELAQLELRACFTASRSQDQVAGSAASRHGGVGRCAGPRCTAGRKSSVRVRRYGVGPTAVSWCCQG